ncbi:hypothetical protein FSP39_001706 [Pinctada imbricata]|uniref:Tesmin/TSO1-like CXC domain-containing protein n=1 Tax=Pinctada imbricata TaxID=66713 RepID=A0AA89C3Z7_PINIB|nr:hypothetical protein FSP39_001706 [Pinctada imbricata]
MSGKTRVCHGKGSTKEGYVNPEILFRRALLLSNLRPDVSSQSVLSYPVGPLPVSIFHEDGSLRKTNKAEFASQLYSMVRKDASFPHFDGPEVFVRDAMGLVQALYTKNSKTFGDLATTYVQSLLSCVRQFDEVADVYDRYDIEFSIKSTERKMRAQRTNCTKIYQVLEIRCLPDWKKFLSVEENKKSLVSFLGNYILKMLPSTEKLPQGKSLYVVGAFDNPETVKVVSNDGITECTELESNQEEADTRIILQIVFADSKFTDSGTRGRIVVQSCDTDVIVLCCHFFGKLCSTDELWVFKGHGHFLPEATKLVPIHEIHEVLTGNVVNVLPVVHALTECDTLSSCYCVGKKSVFKALIQNESTEIVSGLKNIDDNDAFMNHCRKFVAKLYDVKSKFKDHHDDLNSLRYKLATTKESSLARLPPPEVAFIEHVERTRLQAIIWLNADKAKAQLPVCTEHGWHIDNGNISPIPFRGSMSSDVLNELICKCKGKSKCSGECICHSRRFPCTELCLCGGGDLCCNTQTHNLGLVYEEQNNESEREDGSLD